MKNLNLILLCIVHCALCISVTAQTSVIPFDASKDYLNGIVYSLPKTEVNVVITARHTIEKPGPFYQYAERYLATKEIITINNESWSIENIEIQSSAVADPNRTFQVAIDNRGIANNISFYHDNIIAGINIDSICRKSYCHSVLGERAQRAEGLNSSFLTPNSSLNFDYSVLNEDALVATSIPKMAEMVARQIYHIRESRTALLTADLDQLPDGEALKTMLTQLDREEAELVAFFVGKTTSYTVTKTYSITTTSKTMSSLVSAHRKVLLKPTTSSANQSISTSKAPTTTPLSPTQNKKKCLKVSTTTYRVVLSSP